jgi:hypothetical protein
MSWKWERQTGAKRTVALYEDDPLHTAPGKKQMSHGCGEASTAGAACCKFPPAPLGDKTKPTPRSGFCFYSTLTNLILCSLINWKLPLKPTPLSMDLLKYSRSLLGISISTLSMYRWVLSFNCCKV